MYHAQFFCLSRQSLFHHLIIFYLSQTICPQCPRAVTSRGQVLDRLDRFEVVGWWLIRYFPRKEPLIRTFPGRIFEKQKLTGAAHETALPAELKQRGACSVDF